MGCHTESIHSLQASDDLGLTVMNTHGQFKLSPQWRQTWRKTALPACSIAGCAFAFLVVLHWFPGGTDIWNFPIVQIDAPAHYYFIREILAEGPGAALHLLPNDGYYPPLFHLLTAGLMVVAHAVNVHINIYTAFNIVWLVTSGLLWPAGVQLLASYWTRRIDPTATRGLVFRCVMAIVVPLLSVMSASHPFWMLAAGPLV